MNVLNLNIMTKVVDLLELKDKIEKAKIKLNQLEGQKTEQMKTLLTEFKCKSIEEAQAKLDKMEKALDKLEIEIEEKEQELREEHPILFE